MSPERIGNNMWRLFVDEYVAGKTSSGKPGIIKGPTIVRVLDFEEIPDLLVQDEGDTKIVVGDTLFEDFPTKVRTTKGDTNP